MKNQFDYKRNAYQINGLKNLDSEQACTSCHSCTEIKSIYLQMQLKMMCLSEIENLM